MATGSWRVALPRRLAILHSLSPREWRLLAAAVVLVPLTAVALRLRGAAGASRLLAQVLPPVTLRSEDEDVAGDVVRAVDRVAHRLPLRSPCLVRSLSARALLRRAGLDADLKLGVVRDRTPFEAHAWLERHGRVLNDDPSVADRVDAFDHGEVAVPW